jgi:hypothetical protein
MDPTVSRWYEEKKANMMVRSSRLYTALAIDADARRGRATDGRAQAQLRKFPPPRERWTTRVVW